MWTFIAFYRDLYCYIVKLFCNIYKYIYKYYIPNSQPMIVFFVLFFPYLSTCLGVNLLFFSFFLNKWRSVACHVLPTNLQLCFSFLSFFFFFFSSISLSFSNPSGPSSAVKHLYQQNVIALHHFFFLHVFLQCSGCNENLFLTLINTKIE